MLFVSMRCAGLSGLMTSMHVKKPANTEDNIMAAATPNPPRFFWLCKSHLSDIPSSKG
jgi:hypothetical protein